MQIQFYRFQALHEPSNCVVVSPCRVPAMHKIEQIYEAHSMLQGRQGIHKRNSL